MEETGRSPNFITIINPEAYCSISLKFGTRVHYMRLQRPRNETTLKFKMRIHWIQSWGLKVHIAPTSCLGACAPPAPPPMVEGQDTAYNSKNL